MGDNFATRFFAQSITLKLIEQFDELLDQYSVIYVTITEVINLTNLNKGSEKLIFDLKLNTMNYEHIIQYNNVFYEHLQCSDNLSYAKFLEKFFSKLSNKFNCTNEDCEILYKIHNNEYLYDKFDNLNKFNYDVNDSNECTNIMNVQTKIIPMEDEINHVIKNKLIVVASLVTRLSNLGGLSRSCEIFGVDKLVINSLKYINDKEFKALR